MRGHVETGRLVGGFPGEAFRASVRPPQFLAHRLARGQGEGLRQMAEHFVES